MMQCGCRLVMHVSYLCHMKCCPACLFRHHCRHCGKIFCSKCLKAKALVLGDPKPQKICNACSTSGSSDLKVVK